jgi:hypothetical protein
MEKLDRNPMAVLDAIAAQADLIYDILPRAGISSALLGDALVDIRWLTSSRRGSRARATSRSGCASWAATRRRWRRRVKTRIGEGSCSAASPESGA